MPQTAKAFKVENSLFSICLTVAWASSYARKPLNEFHRMWADYFAYSEWFRHRICAQLGLPLSTEWKEIYRRVGVLVEEEYPSKEDWQKALTFGYTHTLHDRMTGPMLDQFEDIKYQITGRL